MHTLAFIPLNPTTIIIALIAAWFIYRRATRNQRLRKAAEVLFERMSDNYTKPSRLKVLSAAPECKCTWFPQTHKLAPEVLAQHNYRLLGFYENTVARRWFSRYRDASNAFVSSDGTTVAVISHLCPLSPKHLSVNLGIGMKVALVGFDTALSDGNYIITSNAPSSVDWGDEKDVFPTKTECMPHLKDTNELLAYHNQRIADYLHQHPDVQPLKTDSLEDVIAHVHRQRQVGIDYYNQRGYLINQREFIRITPNVSAQRRDMMWKYFKAAQEAHGYVVPELTEEELTLERTPPAATACCTAHDEVHTLADEAENNDEILDIPVALPDDPETTAIASDIDSATDPRERDLLELRGEVERLRHRRGSLLNNILLLIISLFIFFQLGWFSWGIQPVLGIIVVLFVHEIGHYLAMRWARYRNLRMVFIPLCGGAVIGEAYNVPAYKRILVSFAGPLPGLLICAVLTFTPVMTIDEAYLKIIHLAIVINALNLLPFTPLDGGHILNELLWQRHRFLCLISKILSGLVFLALALALDSYLLAGLGILNFITIPIALKVARSADTLRRERKQGLIESQSPEEPTDHLIPLPYLRRIAELMTDNGITAPNLKDRAGHAINIWSRVSTPPPRILTTGVLLFLYLFTWFIAFLGIGGMDIAMTPPIEYTSEIVETQDTDGNVVFIERVYADGELDAEYQLSPDKTLYHGPATNYHHGEIYSTEVFHMGRLHGECRQYDSIDGEVYQIQTYEHGQLVSRKELKDGEWTTTAFEDLSPIEKRAAEFIVDMPPRGPDASSDEPTPDDLD